MQSQTVVTSKAFLEKVKITVPGKTILLEDLAEKPRLGEKLAALLMTWTLPARLLERALRPGATRSTLDDLATVIFSSGSTGDPKGVMLTHYNIVSNAEQLGQTFAFSGRDRILGILPFFHSFGFTGTLIAARRARRWRGLSCQPARRESHRRAGARLPRDVPAGDADVPANVHPRLRT